MLQSGLISILLHNGSQCELGEVNIGELAVNQ